MGPVPIGGINDSICLLDSTQACTLYHLSFLYKIFIVRLSTWISKTGSFHSSLMGVFRGNTLTSQKSSSDLFLFPNLHVHIIGMVFTRTSGTAYWDDNA
jgi:hypothetical protein